MNVEEFLSNRRMGGTNSKPAEPKSVDPKVFQEWIKVCSENDTKRVEELINEGKHKYHEFDEVNPSPLHICIHSPKITKILLNSGIPVNLKAPQTMSTPLHFSAFHNLDDTTKLLLDEGADPMSLDFEEVHPYLLARERNAFKSIFHLRKEMINKGKGDFINSWKQVCRPELLMLQRISHNEAHNTEKQDSALKQLENCVSYSFCLPERKELEKMQTKELEKNYLDCLNKNHLNF